MVAHPGADGQHLVRSRDVASDLPAFGGRPVLTAERQELLGFLRTLTEGDWRAATACVGWSVHDVALHLLGRTRPGA
jgi:hypothetical protein